MQEEKNRTTPEQQKNNGKRRRRRKKTATPAQQAARMTGGKEETHEAAPSEPETTQEPERPAQAEGEASAQAGAATPEPTEKALPEKPETPETARTPEEAVPASGVQPAEETAPEQEPAMAAGPETPEAVEEAAPTPAEEAAVQEPEPKEAAAEEETTPVEETAGTKETAAEAEPADAEKEPDEEKNPPEPETTSDSDTDTGEAEEEEPEEELPEEDEKRLSDLTRTVQLSVEQIMARVNEEEAAEPEETVPEPESQEEPEDGETPATLQDFLRSGLSGMAKWLLLVLFVVLVIAGCGVAWLYRSATPDMLPQITVQFAGQTLEPTAYKWKVPVIGNVFKRTYADTLSSTPVQLEGTVEQVSPDFVVSPSDYRTELTVTDSEENVIFEGDVDTFSTFQFTANGTYTAKLVVHSDASSVPGDTSVTGSETWQFSFTVGVRPSIRLSSTTATQGSVVAVRVGDTLDGQTPTIQTDLANVGFFKASSGWVCYLPIPWNQSTAKSQTLVVTAGGYTETFDLKISAASWEYKDYSRDSQRVSPYIGEKDIPAELQKLLAQSEETIAWSNGNFVQPFLNTLDIKLAFGTTEYVGRSYSERSTNNGAGGRTVTNMVLNTTSGELLIAPASGTVVLAKDLGGEFGYTLVIDHGAGVKSIFYNLQKIDVKAGSAVKQGQTLASCGKTTVAEMRIGTVPIDPLQVWRGQCDALKYY